MAQLRADTYPEIESRMFGRFLAKVEAANLDLGPVASMNLRKSAEGCLLQSAAGGFYEMSQTGEQLSEQNTPLTASGSFLDDWERFILREVRQETRAVGPARLQGSPGATLASGSRIRRIDDVIYTTTELAIVGPAGTVEVSVQASVPGSNGNLAANETLTLESDVAGIDSGVTSLGIVGGTDAPTEDTTREDIREEYQSRLGAVNVSRLQRVANADSGVTFSRAFARTPANGFATIYLFDDANDTAPYNHGGPLRVDPAAVQRVLVALNDLSAYGQNSVLAGQAVEFSLVLQNVPQASEVDVTQALENFVEENRGFGVTFTDTQFQTVANNAIPGTSNATVTLSPDPLTVTPQSVAFLTGVTFS